jgi:hypothetical protein
MTAERVEIDNPALAPLAVLVGTWSVEVSNASFLDDGAALAGTMTADWMEGRALLVIRSRIEGGPPTSVQVVGRNENRDDFEVLYADERGVSRVYEMTFAHDVWVQHRADPGFHQRFKARVAPDGSRIEGAWSASADDGRTWQHDFDVTYRREDR